MNNRKNFFIALIFLASVLACATPGLPAAAPSAPAPTADKRLQIMVAETVAAALAQTAQAIPPTPTPTLTPAPTATQMETETPSNGVLLTAQANGSTLVTDERAGYKITLAEGWQFMQVGQQETVAALTPAVTADPLMQTALTSIQNEDPNILRLLAINTQKEFVQNEIAATVKFIWDAEKDMAFNSDADLQAVATELPDKISGLRVASVEIIVPVSGNPFGVIESEITTKNAAGDDVVIRQKKVFFKSKVGTVEITLDAANDLRETVIPVFDAMIDTLQLVN